MSRLAAFWFGVTISLTTACGPKTGIVKPTPTASSPKIKAITDAPIGLSGLTYLPTGQFAAIAEREHKLVVLQRDGTIVDRRDVLGVPAGIDLESIAYLGSNADYVFGTESRADSRNTDSLLFARRSKNDFRIFDRVELDYRVWGITAKSNRGIEGICATGGSLFVAGETIIDNDGARFAPFARLDLESKTWTYSRIKMTSATGKLAGLDCHVMGDTVEIVGIERHYHVRRIVRARFPIAALPGQLHTDVVLDFSHVTDGNPEGLVANPNGFYMVTDNASGMRGRGPSLLIELPQVR